MEGVSESDLGASQNLAICVEGGGDECLWKSKISVLKLYSTDLICHWGRCRQDYFILYSSYPNNTRLAELLFLDTKLVSCQFKVFFLCQFQCFFRQL